MKLVIPSVRMMEHNYKFVTPLKAGILMELYIPVSEVDNKEEILKAHYIDVQDFDGIKKVWGKVFIYKKFVYPQELMIPTNPNDKSYFNVYIPEQFTYEIRPASMRGKDTPVLKKVTGKELCETYFSEYITDSSEQKFKKRGK